MIQRWGEEAQQTIKTCTTNFQEMTYHQTVDKQLNGIERTVEKRQSWWLTTVDSLADDQMGNRFITCDVNGTTKQDEEIYKKQIELELRGSQRTR